MSQLPDGGPLPELQVSVLDDETLEKLFTDLAACAEIFEVQTKGELHEYSKKAAPSLEEARKLLVEGAVRAIQIRYRFQDADWFDTLMHDPSGVRLCRMRQG